MRHARSILLWAMSGLALLLVVASFTGTGVGMGSTGIFTHMVWSYVFGLAILAIVIWQLPPPRHHGRPR